MSDINPSNLDPNLNKGPITAEEVSLEDLDKLLEDEDPEFAAMLAEVRSVEVDTSVDIVSSVDTDDSPTTIEPAVVVEELQGFAKYKQIIVSRLKEHWQQARLAVGKLLMQIWTFLKSTPKRILLSVKAAALYLKEKSKIPIVWIKGRTRTQQLALGATIVLAMAATVLMLANLKGIWLPSINDPIVYSLASGADHSYEFEGKSDTTGFYSAFPQERHEYLFDKIKVNLMRTTEHPNPMAAVELIISVDSSDTAIELGSREVEFFDLIQRILEGESYESMVTDLGKKQFKSKLKRELTQHLTQGWVKDILFKTVVLKP